MRCPFSSASCYTISDPSVFALTATTESRAATARISAQETTLGHKLSSWDLMVSTTSNPLTEFALGFAVFSPVKLDVSSKRIEPSQPCFGSQTIYHHHYWMAIKIPMLYKLAIDSIPPLIRPRQSYKYVSKLAYACLHYDLRTLLGTMYFNC